MLRALVAAAALIPLVLAGIWWLSPAAAETESAATFTVERRKLIDTVIERGTLESQSKVEGKCELWGWQNKITFIVEEGAAVEKGDVVVKFDSSEIENELAQKKVEVNTERAAVQAAEQQIEVQTNASASLIAAAKLEKELAELDLRKYREGDYKAELADIERSIAESKAALQQRSEELKNMRILVKKGYREPERIRQMEQAEKSAEFQLERDEQKKEVLTRFTYERMLTELRSKAEEAGRKLKREEATAKAEISKARSALSNAKERLKIQEDELKEYEEQLEKATIKAPQRGTVAYANHRYMSPDYRIREGGTVHRRQTVFHLPDMNKMQVQVDIHESIINKLAVGQRVAVRVESYPDHRFKGHISKIADLARSDRNSDEKEYSTIVLIEEIPEDVKLKPGMNAETEIHIRTLEDVVAVPVQSITQIAGTEYAYVKDGANFERAAVEVSDGNESYLIVDSGLDVGQEIAMDAYQRGLADIETEGLGQREVDENDFRSSGDEATAVANDADEQDEIEATGETSQPEASAEKDNADADEASAVGSAVQPDSDSGEPELKDQPDSAEADTEPAVEAAQ